MVDEPNLMVKLCYRVGVAGNTVSSVFGRLSCRWCSYIHEMFARQFFHIFPPEVWRDKYILSLYFLCFFHFFTSLCWSCIELQYNFWIPLPNPWIFARLHSNQLHHLSKGRLTVLSFLNVPLSQWKFSWMLSSGKTAVMADWSPPPHLGPHISLMWWALIYSRGIQMYSMPLQTKQI